MSTPYWVTLLSGERILRAVITENEPTHQPRKLCKQHKKFLAENVRLIEESRKNANFVQE